MSFSVDHAAPPTSIEIGGDDVARLRNAAGWARFLAVVGLVTTGLLTLGSIAAIAWRHVAIPNDLTTGLALIAMLGSFTGASLLMLAYDRKVRLFVTQGEPALAQAFRSLRRFFQLWTLYTAFDIVVTILSLLGKR